MTSVTPRSLSAFTRLDPMKPAAAEATPEKRESAAGRGGRGGRNGDRGQRGGRNGEREGRGERGERGERGGRGGKRGEREERTEDAATSASDAGRGEERRSGRGERGERGERGGRSAGAERSQRDAAVQEVVEVAKTDPAVENDATATGFADTQPGGTAEGGESRGERGRRRRRGGRGGRDRDAAATGVAAVDADDDAVVTPVSEAIGFESAAAPAANRNRPQADVAAESLATPETAQGEVVREREGRRRGGRGRSRSEAREATTSEVASDVGFPDSASASGEAFDESPIVQATDSAQAIAVPSSEPLPSEAPPTIAEASAGAAEEAADEAAEPVVSPVVAQVATASVVDTPLRPAQFTLDAEQLQAIAAAAGLQWVGSDAAKIAAAREAMAREPKPVHVPREPRPVAIEDVGPLVMVETRKDLSQIRLPFDTPAAGS